MSANGAYTLTSTELPAIRQVLTAQAQIGPTQPPTTATLDLLMQQLAVLAGAYASISNPTVTGWLDQLYQAVSATGTTYGQNFPALYIAYNYLVGCQNTCRSPKLDIILRVRGDKSPGAPTGHGG